MKKFTRVELEQHYGLTKDCYNDEGKAWSLQIASDFAELTEGLIASVGATLEEVQQLNEELEENLCLDYKLEIIYVDGIYMGIDPEDAEAIRKKKQKNNSSPTCPVCGWGIFIGQSKIIDGDTHYHANCYDNRKLFN